MTKWTSDQQAAIESRGSNLLVSAAAGSGKTAVLVERIIQLISEDQIDIDRLLIVTFTNAAAGEMRERIMKSLMEKVAGSPANEAFLRRQISLVHRASIMTVHAFCIDVVRHYFYEVDLDPSFRIGDTAELGLMLESALDEVMEEAYAKESEAFHRLVESYGSNRSDEGLRELLMKLYFFIQSQPEPLQWLRAQEKNYENAVGIDESMWMQGLLDMVRMDLGMAKELIVKAMNICAMADGPAAYIETFESDLQLVKSLEIACSEGFESLYEALMDTSFARLKSIKKADKETVSPELIEEAKALRDVLKKKIVEPIANTVCRKDKARHAEEMRLLQPVMTALYDVVESFHTRYMEAKREKNILDFNDLEHFAISILKNDEIAAAYRAKYRFIFLDEYQDSNIVQETIISRIKRADNLFLVGDVKQSIYRFRLADPTLFMDKYRSYEKTESAISRRIDLGMNFRSRPEVLEGINYIFERLMSETFGEMAYDDDAKLYPGLEFEDQAAPPLELLIVDSDADENLEDQALVEMKKVELEAHAVARRIQSQLEQDIYDPKSKAVRKTRLGDIVVLLRATKSWAQTFGDVFAHYGIPLYSDVGGGYFEALEIEIFTALMKLVDNRQQDLPLITVLRSPIGGFSIDELIEIRLADQKGPFHQAYRDLSLSDGDLAEKISAFERRLDTWVEQERIWPLDEYLWKLMLESGFYHYVGAMPGGAGRQANMRLLIDKAGHFEKIGAGGLFEFIAFVERLKTTGSDMASATTIAESEDVVRLMSIHKSKGLEFPVVILAGAGKNFNLRDTYDKVLMHKNLGVGLRFADPSLRYYSESLPQMIMKRQLKMESLAEEMRILYVAMTRAVDRLIISGTTGRLESDAKKWVRGDSVFNLMSGKSYLDWVATILSGHPDGESIRDLTELPVFGSKDRLGVRWNVSVERKDDLLTQGLSTVNTRDEAEVDNSGAEQALALSAQWKDEIMRRLSWTYPDAGRLNNPFKLSVSDMKRAYKTGLESANVRIPALIPKPKFMEGSAPRSGADLGTLHHFVMQHLDLRGDLSSEGISLQVKAMAAKNLIRDEDVPHIEIDQISGFFGTELGGRMLASEGVHREVPFIFNKDIEGNDVMVQGIIDCYFEEAEGLVILDYKTDYTGLRGTKGVAESYRVQVELYAEALFKLLGKPVKGAYIYFFDAGESVAISTDVH